MEEWHQTRQIAMSLDEAFLDVAGMTRRVAQPRYPRKLGEPAQQTAERPGASIRRFAMIGVHILPDQRDLAHPGAGQPLGFLDDFPHRPGNLRAARIGHDAEGAKL